MAGDRPATARETGRAHDVRARGCASAHPGRREAVRVPSTGAPLAISLRAKLPRTTNAADKHPGARAITGTHRRPFHMEYQWEFYQLGPGGDLRFEKDLKQLVEYLGHPYPEFFGIPLNNHSGETPQWEVSTERKLGAPIAQNNNGHGNHDHPGSKLKNFQNTNPPIFNKTEEPLDADDWLQTMENNLEVAGVEANEKVLFATHYLAGPARAWWTSTRAMNGGQFMTWEDFKLKFSKYHVPQGLIKMMRDEFRELKQGRMSVVEYRDRFLTLSRYAPDETDTNEKRKERFLNGLHDEMQTVWSTFPLTELR
ncbi:hypothetical protein QYE76_008466 [Lolium multiflorum]|uniref:Retrotransposon gag domain-containing protein n=1 Tax=Lolium multiflorum TaxID=4521 RepID=A0AAD8TT02_LOLMU|nr:hypothetical protein QYE76_008466 [Lolium multiflorum]